MALRLNLGASDRHLDGFTCCDIAPSPCDKCVPVRVDLSEPWPWQDSSVEEIQALDVVEHIGDGYRVANSILASIVPVAPRLVKYSGRIHFLNEAHRVLVPGGKITIETPDASQGAGYYQDPTHTSPWTRNSFQYFGAGPGGDFAWNRLAKAYGITARFKMLSMNVRQYQDAYDPVFKITAVLECVK